MSKHKILVIDDESGIRSSLKGILEDEGYDVQAASTGEKALDMVKNENFELVFLDIWLPEMNGIDVLEKIRAADENIQVVMITGHGSVESAVRATKLGAFNFLEKPLSLEKVILTAKNALHQKTLEEENLQLRSRVKARHHLVGKSPAIQKLRKAVRTASPTDGRVLITGENGCGKEHVARLIHQQSRRHNKRFIQINSAAIPDNLIEDELFGHGKEDGGEGGRIKKGKLLMADGGTLFLDDISEMSLRTQAKLVSVIEEEKFEPIGDAEPVRTDVRIIAASERNLRDMVAEGSFREDLFYKLNVIPMHIPPLRERKEDIPLLINFYLKYFSMEAGKRQKTMNREALSGFMKYSWPGNVSELINVIERFVIMIKEDVIEPSHLFLLVEPIESRLTREEPKGLGLQDAREHFDRTFIHQAMVDSGWDMERAAERLKIDKDTLETNIARLGIRMSG